MLDEGAEGRPGQHAYTGAISAMTTDDEMARDQLNQGRELLRLPLIPTERHLDTKPTPTLKLILGTQDRRGQDLGVSYGEENL